MSFDQDTIDEIKKLITDEEYDDEDLINNGYYEDDIAEARRQLAGGSSSSSNNADEGEAYEGSSSESSSSSEDSDSDDENNNLTAEQKKGIIDSLNDDLDSEADAEYDNDLAEDDEIDIGKVVNELKLDKTYTNEAVENNRQVVIKIQEEIFNDSPDDVQDLLLMMMRNGISNEWTKRYNTDADLNNIITDSTLKQKVGNETYSMIQHYDCKDGRLVLRESETYDAATEKDTNPFIEKQDIQLYAVHRPGHIMAMVVWNDENDTRKVLLFDSNASGSGCLDALMDRYGLTFMVAKEFHPHGSEYRTSLAENIFTGSKGRCASWTLFVLHCFVPLLKLNSGKELDDAIKRVRRFLASFSGERARVMSTLIMAFYTRLQLWAEDKKWFDKFGNSPQQRFLMPDLAKNPKAKRLWMRMKAWKASVKARTKVWLKQDDANQYYRKMFGYTVSAKSDSRNLWTVVEKIVKGGTAYIEGGRYRAKSTKLILTMPVADEFFPFDYETMYNDPRNSRDESYENDRQPTQAGRTKLVFGVNHQTIEKELKKKLDNITWREVLDHIQRKIEMNKAFWEKVRVSTGFNASSLFSMDSNVVTYGQFGYGNSSNDLEYTNDKKAKSKKWEQNTTDEKDDWILHVQQDTVYQRMSFHHPLSRDTNSWPVLLDTSFPFYFNSTFKDAGTMFEANTRRKFNTTNIIHMTFEHGWETREVEGGKIYQLTEEELRKQSSYGPNNEITTINKYNKERSKFERSLTEPTRNKLAQYHRWSERDYQNAAGDEKLIRAPNFFHQKETTGSGSNDWNVAHYPTNVRLLIINKKKKRRSWTSFARSVPDYTRQHQIKLLYALKRAANPQWCRVTRNLRERTVQSEKLYYNHTVSYPDWNVVTFHEIQVRFPNPRQLYNTVGRTDVLVTPFGTFNKDTLTTARLRDVVLPSKPSFTKKIKMGSGEWGYELEEPEKYTGLVNFVYTSREANERGLWKKVEYKMWVTLRVWGDVKTFKWHTCPYEPVGNATFRPPQWFMRLRNITAVRVAQRKPWRIEARGGGPEVTRWCGRFTYVPEVKGERFSPYRRITHTDPKLKTPLEEDIKKQFRESSGRWVPLRDFKKVEDYNEGIKKKRAARDNNGSSSSSIGQKRKKPGVQVGALDFPKLKL